MKRLSVLIFSILGLVLPTHVFSASWVPLFKTNSGTHYFVDTDSIQKDGNSVTFWEKVNYGKRDPDGALSDKSQWIINCKTRESSLRYMVLYDDYDNDGRVIFNGKMSGKWNPIVPETAGDEKRRQLCP